jgi:hypothetical protein
MATSPDPHHREERALTLHHPAVARWFATHHGVANADMLRRLGMTEREISRRVEVGALVRVQPRTYRTAASPRTFEQAAAAACASHPSGLG